MAYSDYSPEFLAHINYKPRYLKPEPEKTQLDEDQEVISMVNRNHTRTEDTNALPTVDADALPSIVVEDDMTMQPKIGPWTTLLSLSAVAGIAISMGMGIYGMIHAVVTRTPTAHDIMGMIAAAFAGLVVLCLWRESRAK